MSKLYENENFKQERALNEKQIQESAEAQATNKNALNEMDTYLKEL